MAIPYVAIRPPEYWPGLAYMALLDQADQVVLADTLQYSRQSYQNRARLRTPQGWQWISVPLRGRQHGTPIQDVVIWQRPAWLKKHFKALVYNYRGSPFFSYYEPTLLDLFQETWTHLGALTCATVERLAQLLRIKTPMVRASELPEAPATLSSLFAAVGGSTLLVEPEYAAIDAPLVPQASVLHVDPAPYVQVFEGFVPDLSTLDLLFNHGPNALSMLRASIMTVEPV